ncbi:hypothetical protein [Ottowia sp.]|uniref:hypothetical protein n=1 Tax=Ottowia sp. TaxID=1898956 RepID=UPI002C7DAE1B|nr:hypothetical protein [Ottowia sp.]HOB66335.1 S8 family serine peptidase [Ottowia sp.]HPZ58331.1 S8 family serine peptidase [Ottowia sp.]HQD47395.1 S8 family serine peptidase [Ottowia sp.]
MATGVDWAQLAGDLPPVDPYLVWADTTAYAGYRLNPGKSPDGWWSVLLELEPARDGKNPIPRLLDETQRSWLQVPAAYLHDALGDDFRYCTARVTGRFFTDDAARARAGVLRYQLGLPVERTVRELHAIDETATGKPADAQPLTGGKGRTVMALIDGGLAFAHAAFCRQVGGQREARVKRYWRQDECFGSRYLGDVARTSRVHGSQAGWNKPAQMGYGLQLDEAAIQAVINRHTHSGQVDEDALYRDLELWSLDSAAHHGTHVFSLATQPYADRLATEDAPPTFAPEASSPANDTADLMAVQLEWANVLDTSGRAMAVSVVDALVYVVSCCANDVRIVVNLSWGTQAGPHDGTSVLEKAMAALCAAPRLKGRLFIVVPAGNHYQARSHAHAGLHGGNGLALSWRIQPDGHTPSFLELWFRGEPGQAKALDNLSIRITQPDGLAETVRPGQWRRFSAGTATAVFPHQTMLGENGSCLLIAVAPTASLTGAAVAPSGAWKIEVDYTSTFDPLPPLDVDAFIERNDVALGLFTGARASYFEATDYNLGASEDMPAHGDSNRSPIRRCGSYNSLATGTDGVHWVGVGGWVHLPSGRNPWGKPAAYSPRRNDLFNAPGNPLKIHPDRVRVTDESPVLRGLRAAGSRSGGTVRLVGTSSAAPQCVRILANGQPLPDNPRPSNAEKGPDR